jgi:phosphatidylserine decarboxylase
LFSNKKFYIIGPENTVFLNTKRFLLVTITGFAICTGWKLFQKENFTEVGIFFYRFCMYVCRLFNNIEFRANPPLYTIVQYINSVDSTMLKIRNEKKNIFIKCMKKKTFSNRWNI